MVMKCFVACCFTRYASNKVKVTKFRAPKDEKQFILWQKAIPRTDRKLTRKDYVCANHFEEKYLTKVKTILDQEFPLKIWKLAVEAIPTLNLCKCAKPLFIYYVYNIMFELLICYTVCRE